MNIWIIGRLLFRRSFVIATGILIAAGFAVVLGERALRDPAYREIHAALNFPIICLAAIFGSLLSFGGFVSKTVSDVAGLPIARIVPGLSRRTKAGAMLLVPAVAFAATTFAYFAIHDQASGLSFVTLASLSLFWVCAGLAIGQSLLPTIVLILLAATQCLRLTHLVLTYPVAANAILAIASIALLRIYRARLTPTLSRRGSRLPATSPAEPPRDPSPAQAPRAASSISNPGATLDRVVAAGFFERFGNRRGLLLVPGLYSVAAVQVALGFFAFAVGRKFHGGLPAYLSMVYTAGKPIEQVYFLRLVFPIAVACAGYIFALNNDCSPRTDIWHPISRRRRRSAVFLAHLLQNGLFAILQALGILSAVYGLARFTGSDVAPSVVVFFLTPIAIIFLLQPIAQACLPDFGARAKRNSNALEQLGAGVLGGVTCLLTAYWANFWPTKSVHLQWSGAALTSLLAAAMVLVYAAYFAHLSVRFVRCDLRPRAG